MKLADIASRRVDAEAIEALEDLLEEARKGTIDGVVVCYTRPNGYGGNWIAAPRLDRALAEVALAQNRIASALNEAIDTIDEED